MWQSIPRQSHDSPSWLRITTTVFRFFKELMFFLDNVKFWITITDGLNVNLYLTMLTPFWKVQLMCYFFLNHQSSTEARRVPLYLIVVIIISCRMKRLGWRFVRILRQVRTTERILEAKFAGNFFYLEQTNCISFGY